MNLAKLFARMKQYNANAEVIFDQEEPLGQTTDMVMPHRRWFRRAKDLKTKQSRGHDFLKPTNR